MDAALYIVQLNIFDKDKKERYTKFNNLVINGNEISVPRRRIHEVSILQQRQYKGD